jgi:hypothetical protein
MTMQTVVADSVVHRKTIEGLRTVKHAALMLPDQNEQVDPEAVTTALVDPEAVTTVPAVLAAVPDQVKAPDPEAPEAPEGPVDLDKMADPILAKVRHVETDRALVEAHDLAAPQAMTLVDGVGLMEASAAVAAVLGAHPRCPTQPGAAKSHSGIECGTEKKTKKSAKSIPMRRPNAASS